MEKSIDYRRSRFTPEVIQEAVTTLSLLAVPSGQGELDYRTLTVSVDGASWRHDNAEEFYSDYRRTPAYAHFAAIIRKESEKVGEVDVLASASGTSTVSVEANRREIIQGVFEVFERALSSSRLPEPAPDIGKPTIFIGHGHSQVWRDLKDHLHEQHGYPIEAYETGARAGHAIRDILDELASKSAFALLVLTADDKLEGETFRARQNVVHETGLFQGRLGFSRAIVMLESGVEEFSNINGIQQIRFSEGNIRETYGDVLATIKREFGDV